MNATQVADVTSVERSSPRTPVLAALPPSRVLHKVPGPAIYKPGSKWAVVAAFILSVALHIGAVALVERDRPRIDVAQNLDGDANSTLADWLKGRN
jgi:hypothetical protein